MCFVILRFYIPYGLCFCDFMLSNSLLYCLSLQRFSFVDLLSYGLVILPFPSLMIVFRLGLLPYDSSSYDFILLWFYIFSDFIFHDVFSYYLSFLPHLLSIAVCSLTSFYKLIYLQTIFQQFDVYSNFTFLWFIFLWLSTWYLSFSLSYCKKQ